MAMHGEITEKINIYCNDVIYEAIKEVSKYILPDKLMKAIYGIIQIDYLLLGMVILCILIQLQIGFVLL